MFLVIGYDCSDDRRRLKVAKILLDYGYRVQYSVFEADLEQDLLDEMLGRLRKVINPAEDSIRVYRLCRTCLRQVEFQGQAQLTHQEQFFII